MLFLQNPAWTLHKVQFSLDNSQLISEGFCFFSGLFVFSLLLFISLKNPLLKRVMLNTCNFKYTCFSFKMRQLQEVFWEIRILSIYPRQWVGRRLRWEGGNWISKCIMINDNWNRKSNVAPHVKSLIKVSKWFMSLRTSLGFLSTQDDYTETLCKYDGNISVRLFAA